MNSRTGGTGSGPPLRNERSAEQRICLACKFLDWFHGRSGVFPDLDLTDLDPGFMCLNPAVNGDDYQMRMALWEGRCERGWTPDEYGFVFAVGDYESCAEALLPHSRRESEEEKRRWAKLGLQARSRLVSEAVIPAIIARRLDHADAVVRRRRRRLLELVDLVALRQAADYPREHWWWYLDEIAEAEEEPEDDDYQASPEPQQEQGRLPLE